MSVESTWKRGPDDNNWRTQTVGYMDLFHWDLVSCQVVAQGSGGGGLMFMPNPQHGHLAFMAGGTKSVNQIELMFQRPKDFMNASILRPIEQELQDVANQTVEAQSNIDNRTGCSCFIGTMIFGAIGAFMFFAPTPQPGLGILFLIPALLCFVALIRYGNKVNAINKRLAELEARRQELWQQAQPYLRH